MARIPEAEIERLKKEIPIEALVRRYGVVLKPQGENLLGHCPFHDDRTPSLSVTPATNLWHCLGACQMGGTVIDWTMKVNGVSFRHAFELLKTDPALAAGAGSVVANSRVRKLPPPVEFSAGEQQLLNQVIDFYHTALTQSPEALAYLDKRGLGDRELIERFKLGFANRTLGLRLPQKARVDGEEVRTRLQKVGLIRESGHEHFNGSLIVPVFDEAGNVTEVYGRKITEKLRAGTPLHLYLPGPHKGVWNARGLEGSVEVILTEALIDAMTFWCAGYRNVTAAYGVEGFTNDHLAAFKRYGTKRVLIAYDRDEAGDRAAAQLAETLAAAGLDCYRIQFPKGMDANDYALKVTPAAKSLGLAIRKAVWLGKGMPPAESPGQHVEDMAPESVPVPDSQAMLDTSASNAASQPAIPSLAALPVPDMPVEVSQDEVVMSLGDRRYRIRGLAKNLSYETLKVNVLVSREDAYYVDTFDLYAARQRSQYVLHAAKELAVRDEIIKVDLGKALLKLEALQDARIKATLAVEPETPPMSDAECDEALALLKSPDLMDRIPADLDICGLIGERTNKLVAYLAAVSRKLDGPLAVVVQSSSAAGKSSLMDAVLAFMPEEERVKYSAMTGQSLFYMGETNLKHKILAICEEEGASRATYALKVLQSDGELTIASTGKDPATGNLITQQYRVEGPVMIFLTTTAVDIDEELLNRCLMLSVDEGRAQTEAIHRLQRAKRTLSGLKAREAKGGIVRLHQNAQRLLRPLAVVNPYADQLTFLSDKTRTRRDHEKYLTLIDTIALLHQHQRAIQIMPGNGGQPLEYIEATLADIAAANTLAHEVLGRNLDELPPQTRRLLVALVDHVNAQVEAQQMHRNDFRFSRREVRAATGWGDTQLKIHLARLVELEYLLVHRAERGQGYVYELLYDGDSSERLHLSGLIDAAALQSRDYDGKRSGVNETWPAPGRDVVGGQSVDGRSTPSAGNPHGIGIEGHAPMLHSQTTLLKPNGFDGSYAPLSLAAVGGTQ